VGLDGDLPASGVGLDAGVWRDGGGPTVVDKVVGTEIPRWREIRDGSGAQVVVSCGFSVPAGLFSIGKYGNVSSS
jgi:hypothetical protein